ncbi:MAG: hypothetical protein JST64_07365 [Actinobacteria bacterium]|nr:hypothetical protein [Actinomycetota bacterium]
MPIIKVEPSTVRVTTAVHAGPTVEGVATVSESCVKHPMTVAEFACGRCGHDFCAECVVFPFGLAKPPMCITCALLVGGISRRDQGRPKLSRRTVRRRLKERTQVTVTRSEVRNSKLGRTTAQTSDLDEASSERWMDGGDAEEFPGGWRQVF